jgi:multicomponent Na+:H+ antiporter subunit F
VTVWVVAAGALVVLLGGAGVAVARGGLLDRLVGLQLVGVVTPLVLVVLAVALGLPILLEVALAVVVLSFVGGLAYARFLERWL